MIESIASLAVVRNVRGVDCYRLRCAKCGRTKDQPKGTLEEAFAKPCRRRVTP